MKNIFEGAKFGDKFITRNGRIAILINVPLTDDHITATLVVKVEDSETDNFRRQYDFINAFRDGTASRAYHTEEDDIVSRYQISEEELDKLASQAVLKQAALVGCKDIPDGIKLCIECFKAGYKKSI